jgi:DNA-binding response OmpR family regulator
VLLAVTAADRAPAGEFLAAAGAAVAVVADVASLRRAAARWGPAALVVADVQHGGSALRSALAVLSRQHAVVLLAERTSESERMELLRAGADHVARRGAWCDVITMLSTVLRRSASTVQSAALLRVGDIAVDTSRRTAQCCGRPLRLTGLELNLLGYFVRHAEIALSRETLLADVWGYHVGGLDTVTVHVRRLRAKMEVDPSLPRYLCTVWGVGYRLEPSPDGLRPRSTPAAPQP